MNCKERYKQHLCVNFKKTLSEKDKWIIDLAINGLKPKMIIMEECDDNIALERERFWIHKIHKRDRGMLLNQNILNYSDINESNQYIEKLHQHNFLKKEEKRNILEKVRKNSSVNKNYLDVLDILRADFEKKYTQEELAITFDCSVKTIRAFLKGELIKWEYLFKLSCILNLEIEIKFI